MKSTYDIKEYGAVGDGYNDDWAAIQSALHDAMAADGCLFIPAGLYLIKQVLSLPASKGRLSVVGEGANNSIILAQSCAGLSLSFEQHGIQQPFGLSMRDVCFRALGKCGTAISLQYGCPPVTNDHIQESVSLDNVQVISDPEGSWSDGIELQSAWNANLSNCFVSGDSANGDWNLLSGSGLNLRGMTVNCHVSNCRFNFWAEGIRQVSEGNRNSEGLFISNTSMIGVQRGVHLCGDALVPNAPRISTMTWTGGLIECRVGGVTPDKISAAIYLEATWTALISSAQFLAEMIPDAAAGKYSYGIVVRNCVGVVVTGCDLNAFSFGFHTADNCRALAIATCTYTNVVAQVVFAPGCENSRSYGHVLFKNAPNETSFSPTNKIGFVN